MFPSSNSRISASTAVLFLARPGLFLRRSLPGFPPPGAGSAPTPSPCLGTGDGARKPQGTLGKNMENMENLWNIYWTKYGQYMEILWKIYGKYMDNLWKNMENTWTTHGKNMEHMEKIWKIYGKPMDKYGKYMDTYGKLWKIHGKYIEQNIDNIWKFYGKYMENTWTNIHRVLVRPCWVWPLSS